MPETADAKRFWKYFKYLRGIIKSVNPKLAQSDIKNKSTRMDKVFPPYQRLALGRWPL